jgi:hypothetical protein
MHIIEAMNPSTRSAVRDCVFRALTHFASTNQHGPVPVKQLFLMAADNLVDAHMIVRPQFLGGEGAGGQKFADLLSGEQNRIFPNYEIPEAIALLIRQMIWEFYLEGILAPATRGRIDTTVSDKDTWIDLDTFMLTPYAVQALTDGSSQIRVYDPDGFLANFMVSNPPPDSEMMSYLQECVYVFRGGHLLASVILLAVASERLLDVLAESLRGALGDPNGTTWFNQKFAQKRDISVRFGAVSAKLMGEYGDKLNDEKLKEPFQSVVTLTFEAIRLARNDVAHLSGRVFTWNEVSGFLHNFVQYHRYINQILAYLANHPKR